MKPSPFKIIDGITHRKCCDCAEYLLLGAYSFVKNKPYPRCKSCDRFRKRLERVRRDHSQVDRKHWLKKAYKLSPEQYEILLKQQNFSCKICETHISFLPDHLCVDHCHNKGIIRGLLCKRCNMGLGLFDDNISHLKRAIPYLT